MCWGDIQIAHQTYLHSRQQWTDGLNHPVAFESDIRRKAIIISAIYESASPGTAPSVSLSEGGSLTIVGNPVYSQTITVPIVLDVRDWGSVLRNKFLLFIQAGFVIYQSVSVAELFLLDPDGKGNPQTRGNGR